MKTNQDKTVDIVNWFLKLPRVFFKWLDVRRSTHNLSLHDVVLDEQLDAVHFAQDTALTRPVQTKHKIKSSLLALWLASMLNM